MSVERDKTLTHAVELVVHPLSSERYAADAIEDAMVQIKERAEAAGMVPLSTSTAQSAYVVDGCDTIVFSIVVNWMERDALEKMQRQSRLMGGGQNGGPR